MLGDSRVENLKNLRNINAEKWLIRPPMMSELNEMVRYADVSLQTEIDSICKTADIAERQGRCHKVILMADLGDIREGFIKEEELLRAAVAAAKMKSINLYGIGVNLTCFSFVQYDTEKLEQLCRLKRRVEEETGHKLSVVSGGNSAAVDLMMKGGMPASVNNLRLGESVLFGKERAHYQFLPDMYNDVFSLECEIVELKEKPSLPWGTIGVDSYGKRPVFTDRGPRRMKAVCALGKQDFDPDTTIPYDEDIIILGASSDHLMLDITDSKKQYRLGDYVRLKLGYFSCMRAFTSKYVKKKII